jgi:hypothetical protein
VSQFSAYAQVGLQPQYGGGGAGRQQVTQTMSTESEPQGGIAALLDPQNPLLWFGVFLAVTVGFASVAGSVRLGKAKVSANVGS